MTLLLSLSLLACTRSKGLELLQEFEYNNAAMQGISHCTLSVLVSMHMVPNFLDGQSLNAEILSAECQLEVQGLASCCCDCGRVVCFNLAKGAPNAQ